MRQVLQGGSAAGRIPIVWSEARRDELRRVASGQKAGVVPVDTPLAGLLLKCADGEFAVAEAGILSLLRQQLEEVNRGDGTFISFLYALFAVQRFDVLAGLLRSCYGFERPLELAVRRDGPGLGRVRWEIAPDGGHRFTFDARALEHDNTRMEILAFQWAFPLYAHYAAQTEQETGSVIINQQDVGQTPGLAWCDNRPDFFLVPDCIFMSSQGYGHARGVFKGNEVPWPDRKSVAFWRGATTGIPQVRGDWRTLDRIRLCEIARRSAHLGIIDAGISSVVQIGDPIVEEEIRSAGLFTGPIPWEKWGIYKYHVDVDGNTNAWQSLFLKLLTGSPVLKVQSARGYEQWYYDYLVPWKNFVPVSNNMADLIDKIYWLIRNDEAAERIGRTGLALAERLTYEREIGRSANVISAAFRYFNGRAEGMGPYGRNFDDGVGV